MEILTLGLFCAGLILCIILKFSILYALGAGLVLFWLYGRRKGFSWKRLFVISLGRDGVNLEYMKLLRLLRENRTMLEGYAGGVITDGESDLYTKSVSRELVFTANLSGCAFVGRPLV